jgi:hypothetical protein
MSKIEITPEMIEAGARILENQFDALPSHAEEIASQVFLAMMRRMRELTE